jgi:hypothetical protein
MPRYPRRSRDEVASGHQPDDAPDTTATASQLTDTADQAAIKEHSSL